MMHLIAMVNPPTTAYGENWSNPLSRHDWLSGRFYADLARTLERGCFDMMFFADALAIPEDHDGNYATTVRTGGKGTIYLDPIVNITNAAAATQHLGVGATVSTSFLPVYHIARSLLTADHLSGGRVAWNIVTSTTDAEARNQGHPGILPPGERYDRADAVVESVIDLWHTWDDDALKTYSDSGIFADPGKIRRAETAQQHGLSRGPLTLPPSGQGHPVLMQAGSSPRGKQFAARWAEVVFAIADSEDSMRALREEIRGRAEKDFGRDPSSVRVLQGVSTVVGTSDADAQRKLQALKDAIDLPAALVKLQRLLHAERLDPQADAAEVLLAHRGATGSVGFEDMMLGMSRRRNFTVADLAIEQALNQLHPEIVGSAQSVAAELEHLYRSGACDGFVLFPALYQSSVEDFVNGVVPELQARGVLRRHYPLAADGGPATLRATMGL